MDVNFNENTTVSTLEKRQPSTCEYCGCGKDDHNEIRDHIDWHCPERPLKCPNNCDAKPIKRKNLDAHHDVCPLQSASCPFKNAGCSVEIVRKDLDNHIAANTQRHLLQTIGKTATRDFLQWVKSL